MKNKLLKITSLVLAIAFALSMVVYAEESDVITMTKDMASLVISNCEDAEVGETISLQMMLNSGSPVNSIAVVDLKYDSSILKFVGFENHDKIDALAMFKTWDEPLKEFMLGLGNDITFDSSNENICTLKFDVLKAGTTEVGVQATVKNNSKVFDVSVKSGSVIAKEQEFGSDAIVERKQDAIIMCIGESASFVNGKKTLIDPANKQVVPYIKNERTLVPLRFVSESIGAEVLWEDGWDYCLIKKDGKEIKITFGSAEFEVNGEKFTYEAPIETVHDRTMVPVRFISEHLGYNVYWQDLNQAVVITPENNPWDEGRNTEKTALVEVIVSIKGILP